MIVTRGALAAKKNMTLEEYRNKIRRLIAIKSDELVLNGSADHAAVIVESMFAAAQSSMRILTRQFHPSVYGADDLVDYAMRFAARPETTTQILIEDVTPEGLKNHPFAREAVGNTNIELRRVPEYLSEVTKVNFSVMDSTGFRYEEDKSKPVAIASFNDADNAQALIGFFGNLWDSSTVINLEAELA